MISVKNFINNLFRVSWNSYPAIVLFLITIIVFGYLSTIGIDDHHDGYILKTAIDIAHGKILFRETTSQYGFLAPILQGLAMIFFGDKLIVIKLLTVFFYGVSAALLWVVWRRILPKWLASVTGIGWLLLAPYYFGRFLPWSSVYALAAQLLTVYFIILFIESKKNLFLLLSGAGTALIFLFRQPVGLVHFVAILAFLVGHQCSVRDKKLSCEYIFFVILGSCLYNPSYL
ncbi:MAG: glycosyltransferase family 39 protein [Deltaproteobacteria bacterium]|nr:glycosyltransferase family 39 protein [Deltaproteobacteria bacterium]